MISLDFIGPLPITENGSKYILTVVDHYSNWLETYPTRETDSIEVLGILISFCSRHGVPKIILSDRGRAFTANLIQQFIEVMNSKPRYSSPYHPRANGKVERMNRVVKEVIKKQIDGRSNWDVLLPWVVMAYNSSVHSSKRFSPYYILHGRKMQLPSSLQAPTSYPISDHIIEIQRIFPKVRMEIMKEVRKQSQYQVIEPEERFNIGDLVWYFSPNSTHGKFSSAWIGPSAVVEVLSPVNYRLDFEMSHGKSNIFHVDNLRCYNPNIRDQEDENLDEDVEEKQS